MIVIFVAERKTSSAVFLSF